jgi:branched-subunit amino acid transport protein
MEINLYVWVIILGGSIVTVLPRILPITIMSKITMNERIFEFLEYIPIAILSALVAADLFTINNTVSLSSKILEILAAVPTIIVAIKKNNLLLTVVVGVVSIAILRLIF